MTINKILHPKLMFSDITHGFFTRKGGFSKSPYNSLNCSFNVEDNESDVKKNLTLICNELKSICSIDVAVIVYFMYYAVSNKCV